MTQMQEQIKDAFVQYVRENGKTPASVYALANSMGLNEKEFYDYYSSFLDIEREIWESYFEDTEARVKSEPVYEEYMVREKLLAFYFTLIEVLKENRSFIVHSYNSRSLDRFKDRFKEYINELIQEGIMTEEIKQRMFVSSKYDDLLWLETRFLISFWLKDKSRGFENTDAAIEKTVNFALDLLGRNLADSAFDFARLLFKR
ncbi:MAG: TetR/AcrR family transcriptional regulator [Bernardetiaceae bacterium]|nr:TetR/AcrR family transcriptional regulator [Bernardetiaceae bacterium]